MHNDCLKVVLGVLLLRQPTVFLKLSLFAFKKETTKALRKDFRRAMPFALAGLLLGFLGVVLLFTAYSISYTISVSVVLTEAIFVFAIAFALSRIKSSLIDEKQPFSVYAVRLVGVLLIVSSVWFLMNAKIAL